MAKEDKLLTNIALFQEKTVRRVWHGDRWYFSVVDVVGILTNSTDPRNYWKVLKGRLKKEGSEVVTKCNQLKMQAADGKFYLTDAADTQGILRIIQSIPSPNAEPFKLWLAEVGTQRLEEIENPELAMERMKALYEAKGYPPEWIEKRMRGIAIRNELTDEWDQRGAEKGLDYAILTNEISHATFGVNIQDHKAYKGLKHENLRDHMTDLELILTMLGEATATTLHRERESQGIPELQRDAREAGDVAGSTRKDIEARTGKKVVSPNNYLDLPKARQQQLTDASSSQEAEQEEKR
jgi:hypothetical protein